MKNSILFLIGILIISLTGCSPKTNSSKSAQEILGNPEYLAISYGGYRENTRDVQPTIEQLKEVEDSLSKIDKKCRWKNNDSSI